MREINYLGNQEKYHFWRGLYSSQRLKWIKTFHQSYTFWTIPVLVLCWTFLIHFKCWLR